MEFRHKAEPLRQGGPMSRFCNLGEIPRLLVGDKSRLRSERVDGGAMIVEKSTEWLILISVVVVVAIAYILT